MNVMILRCLSFHFFLSEAGAAGTGVSVALRGGTLGKYREYLRRATVTREPGRESGRSLKRTKEGFMARRKTYLGASPPELEVTVCDLELSSPAASADFGSSPAILPTLHKLHCNVSKLRISGGVMFKS